MTGERARGSAPFSIPADHICFIAAVNPRDVAAGYLDGWIDAAGAKRLVFLRRCDLRREAGEFVLLDNWEAGSPEFDELAGLIVADWGDDPEFWWYAAVSWAFTMPDGERDRMLRVLADTYADDRLALVAADPDGCGSAWIAEGRETYLLARARSGEGLNWDDSSALMGTDRPEEIDEALLRGEEMLGVAVIGLSLTHPDARQILPRIADVLEAAMAAGDRELCRQAVLSLGHTGRLHGVTDARCLELLRRQPRGNTADDDLWSFVPHRELPWWLWRHHLPRILRWYLWRRWVYRFEDLVEWTRATLRRE
ncbi:hypothetical protein AB0B66_13490 [Catellatospora sp. NPDC049111]|uniref:hypothetical protein n=1 Tax=Catellatospora sp. NPDC049111 TaxID=3155271 RepID=UPI0033F0BE42